MPKAIQKDFFAKGSDFAPRRFSHGGAASLRRRKLHRPLDRKKPVHLVLKSSCAKGLLNLLNYRNKLVVRKIVDRYARKFGVTILGFENMGNHVHLLVMIRSKEEFQNFLRTVTALIARHVTGARKGKPFGKRFWDHLAFTRVVVGRRDMKTMSNYLMKNEVERDFGSRARRIAEEFEQAIAKARRSGRDVWDILSPLPADGTSS